MLFPRLQCFRRWPFAAQSPQQLRSLYRRYVSRALPAGGVLAAVFAALLSGCIAPNLPSYRYHDPHDRGGLLGDYRRGAGCGTAGSCHSAGAAAPCHCGSGDDLDGTEPPPEIPWPRYHPVPTRPVFSLPATLPTSPDAGPGTF